MISSKHDNKTTQFNTIHRMYWLAEQSLSKKWLCPVLQSTRHVTFHKVGMNPCEEHVFYWRRIRLHEESLNSGLQFVAYTGLVILKALSNRLRNLSSVNAKYGGLIYHGSWFICVHQLASPFT
jgi:hypothetical protein